MKSIYLFSFLLLSALSNQAQTAQTFVNKVWQQQTGEPDTVDWQTTAYDGDGAAIVVGNTTNGLTTDLLVTKYDRNGALEWQVTYGDPLLPEYGTAVCVDANSDYYVAGAAFDASTHFDYVVFKFNKDEACCAAAF